ncbi:hypothetical protein LN040_04430 [Desulfovibrio subterraneus]|uniref:hypothetical protein n=1 Tax=Desulfovibrio subterraneus TaxID=2718620 RepID=UPI0022B8B266|nr:hypothetical protein [Desulfovibrio subterraneus]WBF68356.1 hypothetical protein LN040_04430 [Desulfovibrio subterraneus]
MGKHKWTYDDDVLACYIAKYGECREVTLKSISNAQGMTVGSLRMRIQNFKALAGKPGLSDWKALSEQVFQDFKNVGQDDHAGRCIALVCLK